MPIYIPGQRWISDTEPELGLGTILSVEGNRVTVLFIASGERRIYARANAPLTRVRFNVGDTVESADGWKLKVSAVRETDGLLTYAGLSDLGKEETLEEIELNHFLQFNQPQERLFSGQLDPPDLFQLRYQTLNKIADLEQSPVRGLCGSRTSLIPHQLYIAHEVANRHAPRVLLADEVGLGKTIEAGLIVHHQLLTGRAERILIIVPEPLLHQWLVEMRRRFNLKFSLLDEERYEPQTDLNPFLDQQLVLCSLDFLMDAGERQRLAINAGWDLCIIDEAHHLEWSESESSPEYAFVAELAVSTLGLLLLTATPEQFGKMSHFGRLRLLDPDRFYSFEHFLQEEREYEELANVIQSLIDHPRLDGTTRNRLKRFIAEDQAERLLDDLDTAGSGAARAELIRLLLDRHGTGRILFRNTRNTVSGFPKREIHPEALPLPAAYTALAQDAALSVEDLLHPESLYRRHSPAESWWRIDPRVSWLIALLRRLRPAKFLVISAMAQTAIDLEEALRSGGVRATVFHEGMSIVARDRSAAWFADEEEGAQVLVCSEIGSEGRNFQFVHHLVLFDLPLNPDLLEQRIGRLDRIGQQATIRIHVGYFQHGAQATLFRWYHEGLDALARPCPAGAAVFARLRDELCDCLWQDDSEQTATLIANTRQLNGALLDALHRGRNRLLELNSCRPDEAARLVQLIHETDQDPSLWPYIEHVFDVYGVTVEEHSPDCYILLPGDHMRIPHFPELPEDGATVTLNRQTALAREDMFFLTWEHPLVRGAMDLILNSEHGNAAVALVRHAHIPGGKILLETMHLVECPAPRRLRLGRFLPRTVIRSLFDQEGEDWSHIPLEELVAHPPSLPQEGVIELIRSQQARIDRLLRLAEKRTSARLPHLISAANQRMLEVMTLELKRISALKRVNPNVRQEEVDQLKQDALEMHGCIQSSQLRLDAVRLLITVSA